MFSPSPRIYADVVLKAGQNVSLPEKAARHVQVLRMQPGQYLTLFNGQGGEWQAEITAMGRSNVDVLLGSHDPIERHSPCPVTLMTAVPANERMDFLVEKATELGVYALFPVIFERSVVRLNAERAEKKRAHWQAIAIAACEQCGSNRVPVIAAPLTLLQVLERLGENPQLLPVDRRLLGFVNAAPWPKEKTREGVCVLSGPEGGLTAAEEVLLAEKAGFMPYSLGPRVLRADTAPLAALSTLTI